MTPPRKFRAWHRVTDRDILRTMIRSTPLMLLLSLLLPLPTSAWGYVNPEIAKRIFESASPSLVAVQYTWDSEFGRHEIIGAGIVITGDGIVMASLGLFDLRIPDAQMTQFKILVPRSDDEPREIDAIFLGRDERTGLVYLKPASGQTTPATRRGAAESTTEPGKRRKPNTPPSPSTTARGTSTRPGSTSPATPTASATNDLWKPIRFKPVKVSIGEPLVSVGMLPREAGYRTYICQSAVSAHMRGDVPHVMVSGGGLAAVGAPVFNAAGDAIGFVNAQREQPMRLNDDRNPMQAVTNPPIFFIPASDFIWSFDDLPVAGAPQKLPWIGIMQLNGVKKDLAEVYGLKNQTAVEIGDVIGDSPAGRAGLKPRYVIVKVNGEPIERGDEPDELPGILHRKMLQMKVGQTVALSVLTQPGAPLKQFKVKLEDQPKRANLAERFHAEDLGFTARELVFYDAYVRRLPADAGGVVVAWLKPQGAAQTALLQLNDLITEMNRQPVKDLDQFRKAYQEFRKTNPRDAVVLVVQREAGTQTIRIEPPQ